MANAKKSKLIKIYGVTLARPGYRLKPYGHGSTTVEGEKYEYVDYFIDDLVVLIKKQDLAEAFIEKLQPAKLI